MTEVVLTAIRVVGGPSFTVYGKRWSKNSEHVRLQRRFHFLTTGQRNDIFHAIRAAIAKYDGLPGLTSSEKRSKVISLSRKYGVPATVIDDVYEYLCTLELERTR